MPVGARDAEDQRDALAVRDDVALAAELASVRRVGPGVLAPLGLATLAASRLARLKSSLPAPRNLSSNNRCRRCHTPAACQSRRRRQQVMPLPKPSSWGNASQGIPMRRTNRMPFKAISSLARGRPALAEAATIGNSGATFLSNAALISLFLFQPMPCQTPIRCLTMTWFCQSLQGPQGPALDQRIARRVLKLLDQVQFQFGPLVGFAPPVLLDEMVTGHSTQPGPDRRGHHRDGDGTPQQRVGSTVPGRAPPHRQSDDRAHRPRPRGRGAGDQGEVA